eukprot:tig00001027_g6392.t1
MNDREPENVDGTAPAAAPPRAPGVEAGAGIGDLPRELLSLCLSFLDARERCRAAAACRQWRAAASQAPHSESLDLRVPRRVGESDADQRAAAAARRARRPTCSRSPSARASAACGSTCASSRRGGAAGARGTTAAPPRPRDGRGAGALEAAPRSLERLHVALAFDPHSYYTERAAMTEAFLWLLGAAIGGPESPLPGLRELIVECDDGILVYLPELSEAPFLAHARVEYLHAEWRLWPGSPRDAARLEAALAALPALRACFALRLEAGLGGGTLPALPFLRPLAARPLRFGRVELHGSDLAERGAGEALAAIVRPGRLPHGSPEAPQTPCLELHACALPEAWPEGAFAGLQRLTIYGSPLRPPTLQWLVGGAHVPTLRSLVLLCKLEGVSPGDVLGALLTLPAGVKVKLSLERSWREAETAAALDAIAADPPRAARFKAGIAVDAAWAGRPLPAVEAALARLAAPRTPAAAPADPPRL